MKSGDVEDENLGLVAVGEREHLAAHLGGVPSAEHAAVDDGGTASHMNLGRAPGAQVEGACGGIVETGDPEVELLLQRHALVASVTRGK